MQTTFDWIIFIFLKNFNQWTKKEEISCINIEEIKNYESDMKKGIIFKCENLYNGQVIAKNGIRKND